MNHFNINNPPKLVAFSGGGGAATITRLKGGRKTLAAELSKNFPNITFMPSSANSSVDLVLTPNGIFQISPTKSRLTGGAPSMRISDFLYAMKRPDLITTLQILPEDSPSASRPPRSPRSPRCATTHSPKSAVRSLNFYDDDDVLMTSSPRSPRTFSGEYKRAATSFAPRDISPTSSRAYSPRSPRSPRSRRSLDTSSPLRPPRSRRSASPKKSPVSHHTPTKRSRSPNMMEDITRYPRGRGKSFIYE